MPMSATACRTSSNLNGLMTAVINFIHLSPLSSVNGGASGTASAYYSYRSIAASVPARKDIESMGCATRGPIDAPTWRNFDHRARYGSASGGQIREVKMSFINSSGLDELARRLADSVPESVRAFGRDLEGNFKAVLQAQLSKLDLVSRQEFDVQAAILERTQAKLTAMEARLKEIEGRLTPQ